MIANAYPALVSMMTRLPGDLSGSTYLLPPPDDGPIAQQLSHVRRRTLSATVKLGSPSSTSSRLRLASASRCVDRCQRTRLNKPSGSIVVLFFGLLVFVVLCVCVFGVFFCLGSWC